jgi:hypothetical protein
MNYSPKILSSKQPLKMDDIVDLLELKDLEAESYDTHVEYKGDRFDYLFWHGSIIQRDYGGNASRNDFEAWKIVYQKVEDDIKFPYTTELEPSSNSEN